MSRWIATAIALTLLAGPARADDAASKATYDKMCASCHGADGHGNAAKAAMLKVVPELLDLGRADAKRIPLATKRAVLADGRGKMPGYAKKLQPAELDPLLEYSLGLVGTAAPAVTPTPPPPAATTTATAAPAVKDAKVQAMWDKQCAGCHGPKGAGRTSKALKLKIDAALLDLGREASAKYTREELATIVSNGKGKMPAFKKKLKAPDREALVDHAAALAAARRAK